MKKQIILVPLLVLLAFNLKAQTPDPTYLNKALQQLESGNCDAAQLYYNAYKELTGDSISSVEALIANCFGNPDKTYKLGDQMTVGEITYTVAYIRNGGKHGLAVFDEGWKSIAHPYSSELRQKYIIQKGIPTFDELKLLYENRDAVRLFDVYWSCTVDEKDSYLYKTMDFSTGTVDSKKIYDPNAVVLLIHRF